MKTILILVHVSFSLTVFAQFEKYESFGELDSLSMIYFGSDQMDSAILAIEYGFKNFPEQEEKASYILGFLYTRAGRLESALENWKWGQQKNYFYGLDTPLFRNRFKDNPVYVNLAEKDRAIRDSLDRISHVEYKVFLPGDYSGNALYPVVFIFHGNGMNMERARDNWKSDFMEERFVVVFLQSYIHRNRNAFVWKSGDEKTMMEFKEIYKQILDEYSVDREKVFLLGMSAGGRTAIEYAFQEWVTVSGVVLNCPVIPETTEKVVLRFAGNKKKLGIITGENDFALQQQNALVEDLQQANGISKITIVEGMGHEFAKDFPDLLNEYMSWILNY